jgi:hypothetical protein
MPCVRYVFPTSSQGLPVVEVQASLISGAPSVSHDGAFKLSKTAASAATTAMLDALDYLGSKVREDSIRRLFNEYSGRNLSIQVHLKEFVERTAGPTPTLQSNSLYGAIWLAVFGLVAEKVYQDTTRKRDPGGIVAVTGGFNDAVADNITDKAATLAQTVPGSILRFFYNTKEVVTPPQNSKPFNAEQDLCGFLHDIYFGAPTTSPIVEGRSAWRRFPKPAGAIALVVVAGLVAFRVTRDPKASAQEHGTGDGGSPPVAAVPSTMSEKGGARRPESLGSGVEGGLAAAADEAARNADSAASGSGDGGVAANRALERRRKRSPTGDAGTGGAASDGGSPTDAAGVPPGFFVRAAVDHIRRKQSENLDGAADR